MTEIDPRALEQARSSAEKVAAKTVHTVVASYIEYAASQQGYDTTAGQKLALRVRAATAIKLVGGCAIEIPRTKYTLMLSPIPTDESHKLDMMIPPMGDEEFHNANVEKLRREIFNQIGIVRQMVIAYFHDFRKNKPKLWRDIDTYLRHNINIVPSETSGVCLKIEAADSSTLSAPNCVVGIDHYYMDINGNTISTRLSKPPKE